MRTIAEVQLELGKFPPEALVSIEDIDGVPFITIVAHTDKGLKELGYLCMASWCSNRESVAVVHPT